MKTIVSMLVLCGVLSACASIAPFADGARVAVVGGSMVADGEYVKWMSAYWQGAHPDSRVTFAHCGYMGDTVSSALERWSWDVTPVRATRVLAVFEMTDGGLSASADYLAGVRRLVFRAKGEGARVDVLTSVSSCEIDLLCRECGIGLVRVAPDDDARTLARKTLLAAGDSVTEPSSGVRAAAQRLADAQMHLRLYARMTRIVESQGMYLGDNLPDRAPTCIAIDHWHETQGNRRPAFVARLKSLYGRQPEAEEAVRVARRALWEAY